LPNDFSPLLLYHQLQQVNPAPFAAFLNFSDTMLLSASPERFLQLQSGWIEARPIKGTRPRDDNVEKDQKLAEELLTSEKERAENTMIVDLLRNDLSRVCVDHSVQVTQLCGLESFATVHHLVSVIIGQLKPEKDAIDLLRATFPGGSITGAPKLRAMEIIAELEPTARGPYCGCFGYIGFDGTIDTAITIRTYTIKNKKITFQTGGGIVADSDPLMEYQEMQIKAQALQHALIDR
jgi:para-aminobenzoate synthetase component 1